MATITRAETSDHTYDSSVEQTSGATSPHSVIRRLAERFALIAFGLYHIPLFLNNYPSLGGGGFNDTGLAPRWGRIFTIPSIWVAALRGLLEGSDAQAPARIEQAIDRAFDQSPYLGHP